MGAGLHRLSGFSVLRICGFRPARSSGLRLRLQPVRGAVALTRCAPVDQLLGQKLSDIANILVLHGLYKALRCPSHTDQTQVHHVVP